MIITFTNRKGGVGKSTMSSHTAAYLAAVGLRVGLVDTDSQGHAGCTINVPEADGLYELLINKAPVSNVVVSVPAERYSANPAEAGALYMIPSSSKSYKIPFEMQPDEVFLFLETMQTFQAEYQLDAIIIDTSPSVTMLDSAIYMATDGFVYVTECERLSIEGLQDAVQQMLNFGKTRRRYLNVTTKIIGIIPNKMRADTSLQRVNLESIAEAYKPYVWPPVRQFIVWAESANNHQPVWMFAPRSQARRDAEAIGQRVYEAVKSW